MDCACAIEGTPVFAGTQFYVLHKQHSFESSDNLNSFCASQFRLIVLTLLNLEDTSRCPRL